MENPIVTFSKKLIVLTILSCPLFFVSKFIFSIIYLYCFNLPVFDLIKASSLQYVMDYSVHHFARLWDFCYFVSEQQNSSTGGTYNWLKCLVHTPQTCFKLYPSIGKFSVFVCIVVCVLFSLALRYIVDDLKAIVSLIVQNTTAMYYTACSVLISICISNIMITYLYAHSLSDPTGLNSMVANYHELINYNLGLICLSIATYWVYKQYTIVRKWFTQFLFTNTQYIVRQLRDYWNKQTAITQWLIIGAVLISVALLIVLGVKYFWPRTNGLMIACWLC